MRHVPGVWPGVETAVMPGTSSLPPSYCVILLPSAPKHAAHVGEIPLRTSGTRLALLSSLQNFHSAAGTMISALGNGELVVGIEQAVDVVAVKMRDDDGIELLGVEAGGREIGVILAERALALIE